ncbi:hypothetical protein EUGRSUZ_A02484, partial [Eucalyptus grandis]
LGSETLTHLRLSLHEVFDESNATILYAAHGNATNLVFGTVSLLDNALRPEAGSKVISRAQALAAITSQIKTALTKAMNFVFTDGKLNRSVLTKLGRNDLGLKVREMPIVGRTGAFRFAWGYVRTSTVFISQTNKTAVAAYNLHVLHY